MTRHPGPTPATAKGLYGTAAGCAYPGCPEPLFREVENGTRALNSTIAHIRAASPKGPRFDPAMSPEENRAEGNLILLCLFHGGLVDSQEGDFSVETLTEWKKGQIKGGSTEITDAEAETVLVRSIRTEITMRADVINVGGVDGGGGGAIGLGAIGGPGGDFVQINLDGQPGSKPGAGGGGGGVAVPGSVPLGPDSRRAVEGEGFSTEYDGLSGGDTVISTADGQELLRAEGGKGSLAGTGIRSQTEHLEISTAMLANFVEQQNGLFYSLGGGWQTVSILNLPTEYNILLLLVIEAGRVEAGEYTLKARAVNPDGFERGRVEFPVTVTKPGEILRIPRFIIIPAVIDAFGLWVVEVTTETGVLVELGIAVRRVTDPRPESDQGEQNGLADE